MAAALLLVTTLLATSATADHDVPDWQVPDTNCVRKPLNATVARNTSSNVNSSMVLPCSTAYPWEGCSPPGPGLCAGKENMGMTEVVFPCAAGWGPA